MMVVEEEEKVEVVVVMVTTKEKVVVMTMTTMKNLGGRGGKGDTDAKLLTLEEEVVDEVVLMEDGWSWR